MCESLDFKRASAPRHKLKASCSGGLSDSSEERPRLGSGAAREQDPPLRLIQERSSYVA